MVWLAFLLVHLIILVWGLLENCWMPSLIFFHRLHGVLGYTTVISLKNFIFRVCQADKNLSPP